MLVGLCNMFFASALATEVTVYGWLLVFLGYVVVDTQVAAGEAGLLDLSIW